MTGILRTLAADIRSAWTDHVRHAPIDRAARYGFPALPLSPRGLTAAAERDLRTQANAHPHGITPRDVVSRALPERNER